MIIYDCEIEKAIATKKHPRMHDVEYCDGWRDFEGMGLTVVAVYDYWEDRYRIFMEDNYHDLMALFGSTDLAVGFNSIAFDNPLLRANGFSLDDTKCYDILQEVWVAAGLSREFNFGTHVGFGLGDLCETNFGISKSGDGALAPIDWQRGRYGSVTDYCIHDVWLTKKLMDQILKIGKLINPKTKDTLIVRRP